MAHPYLFGLSAEGRYDFFIALIEVYVYLFATMHFVDYFDVGI